jgi:hypothetical protein
MYEGVTEYFANLFQTNRLIDEEDYYGRLSDQIERASAMNDTMSFTKMSAPREQFSQGSVYNVYRAEALIGMCIDINEKVMEKRYSRFNAKLSTE